MRVMVLIHEINGSKSLTAVCRGLYLVLALHPAHSDVIFVGFPRPFLKDEGRQKKNV